MNIVFLYLIVNIEFRCKHKVEFLWENFVFLLFFFFFCFTSWLYIYITRGILIICIGERFIQLFLSQYYIIPNPRYIVNTCLVSIVHLYIPWTQHFLHGRCYISLVLEKYTGSYFWYLIDYWCITSIEQLVSWLFDNCSNSSLWTVLHVMSHLMAFVAFYVFHGFPLASFQSTHCVIELRHVCLDAHNQLSSDEPIWLAYLIGNLNSRTAGMTSYSVFDIWWYLNWLLFAIENFIQKKMYHNVLL